MMRTGPAPALAEAVRPVAALRCGPLRCGGTVLRTLDGLTLAVSVRAIVCAVCFRLLSGMPARRR